MGEEAPKSIDRLGMRGRPDKSPVMHQRWEDLLFMHWAMDPSFLRPLVPSALDMDLFDGKAWVGITPFHLEDVRPVVLPAFPGLSTFDELNVRTYVLHNGRPGIWFFSLDASKLMPVVASRIFFMLPYYKASITFQRQGNRFGFESHRQGPPEAAFRVHWQTGSKLRDPDVDSLAFFLIERYSCFAGDGGRVYETRIYHHPWILEEAIVDEFSSNMMTSLGLREPIADPLVHFSRSLEVEVWAPAEMNPGPPSRKIRIPVE